MSDWRPIETHPRNEDECLLGIFDEDGLYVADRGGWKEGAVREEWDEVEDGVSVRLWQDQDEGSWWSNHCIIDCPTHWAPLSEQPEPPEAESAR